MQKTLINFFLNSRFTSIKIYLNLCIHTIKLTLFNDINYINCVKAISKLYEKSKSLLEFDFFIQIVLNNEKYDDKN